MVWKWIIKTTIKGWHIFKSFGEKIASVVNFILLIPVYFIGIGVTKICAHFSGASIMIVNQAKEKKSYWMEYNCKTETKEKYKRMF